MVLFKLIGWSGFSIIYTAVDSIHPSSKNAPFFIFVIVVLLIFLGGLIFSHLMRSLIIYWGLMKLRLRNQILFLFGLTALFTLLFWLFFTVFFYISIGAGKLLPFVFSSLLRMEIMQVRGLTEQVISFSIPFIIWNLLYVLIHYDRRNRDAEWKKLVREKEMMELEAREAPRARARAAEGEDRLRAAEHEDGRAARGEGREGGPQGRPLPAQHQPRCHRGDPLGDLQPAQGRRQGQGLAARAEQGPRQGLRRRQQDRRAAGAEESTRAGGPEGQGQPLAGAVVPPVNKRLKPSSMV